MGVASSSEARSLWRAAKADKYDVVAELVSKNPSLVTVTDWMGGQNVWHIAAIHGHLNVMKSIESALSQGPTVWEDVTWEDVAATTNCETCYSAPGASPTTQQRSITASLLRGCCKEPATGPNHWKPLLRLGHSLQAILAEVVNQVDSRVRTPLHYACMNGHEDCVAFLLELGADPWQADILGNRTCLHYAAAAGQPECIKAIMSKCAGPHPQRTAPRPNRPETQLVDVRNSSGFAPLHYAVWASHADAVQALLSFDAYLFPRNLPYAQDWIVCADGSTPLHLAAMRGDLNVARALLRSYAECMVLDNSSGVLGGSSRHRANLPDPRLVLNGRNQLAYQLAQRNGDQAMTEVLHPSIPFAYLFSTSDFQQDSRLFGPCRLAVLAANALQAKLLEDIALAAAAVKQQDLGEVGGADPPSVDTIPSQRLPPSTPNSPYPPTYSNGSTPAANASHPFAPPADSTPASPSAVPQQVPCSTATAFPTLPPAPPLPQTGTPFLPANHPRPPSTATSSAAPAATATAPASTSTAPGTTAGAALDAVVQLGFSTGQGSKGSGVGVGGGLDTLSSGAAWRGRGHSLGSEHDRQPGEEQRGNGAGSSPFQLKTWNSGLAPLSPMDLLGTSPPSSGPRTSNPSMRYVENQLRIPNHSRSSRRNLLSLTSLTSRTSIGALERDNSLAPGAAADGAMVEDEPQDVPVTDAEELATTFSLQDTLHMISGRLGDDKEAFRQQFRRLRLTAGVQQAGWEMGHKLLPPARALSVPRPTLTALPSPSAHPPTLKRANTDTQALCLAMTRDMQGEPGAAEPRSRSSSRLTNSTIHTTAANAASSSTSQINSISACNKLGSAPLAAYGLTADEVVAGTGNTLATSPAASSPGHRGSFAGQADNYSGLILARRFSTESDKARGKKRRPGWKHPPLTPNNQTSARQCILHENSWDREEARAAAEEAAAVASEAAEASAAASAAATTDGQAGSKPPLAANPFMAVAAAQEATSAANSAGPAASASDPTADTGSAAPATTTTATPPSAQDAWLAAAASKLAVDTSHVALMLGLPTQSGEVDDDGDDDRICEICMDKPQQLHIPSCGHRLCMECATELCKLHHFRPALCPFCRSIIKGFSPCLPPPGGARH